MYLPFLTHHILLHLTLLSTLTPPTSAAKPHPLTTISNPTLPNPNLNNNSTDINPPRITIAIDSTHNICFTQYRHLTPERNYFAAIISIQTSLIAEYFSRRVETLEMGGVSLDAYGATIYFDNPTGLLTYEMAHRMLGELGEFLMEMDLSTARFELWEAQGGNIRQLSEGCLTPEHPAKVAV